MIFWMVLALSLVVALFDRRYYRHHVCGYPVRWVRRAFVAFCLVSDLLPLAVMAILKLLPDNPTCTTLVGMWLFWIYLLLVKPRFIFYIFHHFARPRTGAVAGGIMALLLVWGVVYARTNYVIREVEVHSERLPAGFDGLRIVQFSDLHIGTLVNPRHEMERLVRTINSQSPDLIVFSGDLINIRYQELDTMAMRILSGLKAPMGVVSNLGNHDTGVYVKDSLALPVAVNTDSVIMRQRRMGWRLPDNATEYLVRNGDTISLTALSFDPSLRKARHDREIAMDISGAYDGVPKSRFNITLSHLPQLWDQIRALGYGDLTLSGHVHAMQMKVRIGRWSFSPARLLYRRWSGRYDDDAGGTLYINDGIGCVGWPMRLGAYPEITVITLRR